MATLSVNGLIRKCKMSPFKVMEVTFKEKLLIINYRFEIDSFRFFFT